MKSYRPPVFIAAVFTIVKTRKQPKCPPAEEWVKKMWSIHTMEYYSAIKKECNHAICSNMGATRELSGLSQVKRNTKSI